MKTSEFQKYIGVTSLCMKIIDIANKGSGQLTSNENYFSCGWFGSINNAEDMASAGVNYCWTVKTIHKGFCLATLENIMKYWP